MYCNFFPLQKVCLRYLSHHTITLDLHTDPFLRFNPVSPSKHLSLYVPLMRYPVRLTSYPTLRSTCQFHYSQSDLGFCFTFHVASASGTTVYSALATYSNSTSGNTVQCLFSYESMRRLALKALTTEATCPKNQVCEDLSGIYTKRSDSFPPL